MGHSSLRTAPLQMYGNALCNGIFSRLDWALDLQSESEPTPSAAGRNILDDTQRLDT